MLALVISDRNYDLFGINECDDDLAHETLGDTINNITFAIGFVHKFTFRIHLRF